MVSPNQLDSIYDWLFGAQEYCKDLTKDLTYRRDILLQTESIEFHNHILDDYNQMCKLLISQELSKQFGISAEDAIIISEAINIQEYL